jgi:hypothetical protein
MTDMLRPRPERPTISRHGGVKKAGPHEERCGSPDAQNNCAASYFVLSLAWTAVMSDS